MFCEKCGSRRSLDAKFCNNCGSSLNEEVTSVDTTAQVPENIVKYERIGGWLNFVGLSLFVTPFILIFGIIESYSLIKDGAFKELNSLTPGMANTILFEMLVSAAIVLLCVYLLFIFNEKKKSFPKYFIWYLLISLAYLIIDYSILATLTSSDSEMNTILDTTLSEGISSTAGTLIGSLIWIMYMKKSKRVKGTFVN